MKVLVWIVIILIMIVCAIYFWMKSNKRIVYQFKQDTFEFKINETDTVPQSVHFWTGDIKANGSDEFYVHYIYSEKLPHVKQLKNIQVVLLDDKKQTINPSKNKCTSSFFNGKINVEQEIDLTKMLQSQFNWSDVEYTHTFLNKEYKRSDNDVNFEFEHRYKMEQLPEQLFFTCIIEWEDGSKSFQTELRKTNYQSPKINPKY